jgi:TetR/AcrR family transcriptional regulator, transcriptional repressor for nem operon
MIRLFEANLDGQGAREQALVLVALCVGGMVLARAMDDQALADDFRNASYKHALRTAGWQARGGG